MCLATGSFVNAANVTVALVERWNGRRWSIQQIQAPAGATATDLNGVSCASDTACTVVGEFMTATGAGSPSSPLVERWNGRRWSMQPIPAPAGTTSGYLRDVSCVSSTICTAVGYVQQPGTASESVLAERHTPKGWSIQSTPSSPNGSGLDGVSCATQSSCFAVGTLGYEHAAIAEGWDGTTWTTHLPPQPPHDSLVGTSCISKRVCIAVGSLLRFDGYEQQRLLVERYS
jgi:hypothetical protein